MSFSNQIKFLLVDASHQLRLTEKEYLREMGYTEIFEAGRATEAWTMIKNMEVDAVVCGWDLPEMTGLVLLKIVRADKVHAHTPFILLIEDVGITQVVEAGEAGVSDILTLPFSQNTFTEKVNQALYPKEDPEAAEFQRWFDRAVGYLEEGRFVESLDMLERCMTIYENAEVYYNVGYIKTAQSRYEEALDAFRKATQIDKDHARAYHMMSVVYGKLRQMKDGQACLNKAIHLYAENKLDDEAEKVLMQALELDPDTINIFNSLGIYYRRRKRYEEAKRYYLKALKVTPRDEHIYYNLARVYISEKNHSEARRFLKAALDIQPNFQSALDILEKLGS